MSAYVHVCEGEGGRERESGMRGRWESVCMGEGLKGSSLAA